jgi:hypothetical protein
VTEQKRTQPRFLVEHTVFIELLSPRMGNNESGKVAMCKTLDISCDGLRVSLEQELTVGAILQIGVQVPDSQDTLYLAGEVRWCRAAENVAQRWTAGFKLMNADNSDIGSWIALVTRMES